MILFWVVLLCWIVALWTFSQRHWLLAYYALGTTGIVVLTLVIMQTLALDTVLDIALMRQTSILASFLGFGNQLLRSGSLLISGRDGLIATQVSIECSALLEMSIMTGLLFFYPLFLLSEKILYSLVGILVIYLLNLVRLLSIVALTTWFDYGGTLFAHFFLGKAIFFLGILVLFWKMLTKPTLSWVNTMYSTYDGHWMSRIATVIQSTEKDLDGGGKKDDISS